MTGKRRSISRTAVSEPQYVRVARILRERIVSGELRPGQRLVRRTLAKEIGVSPIPVIEALHRLEQEGLVEHEQSVGARVRPLTVENVHDDLVLREAIESQVARILAGRLGPTLFDELRGRAETVDASMQRGVPDDEHGMAGHAEFHFELARLTGRPVLLRELRKVWSRRFMRMAWIDATVTAKVPSDWHQRLVEALASGDPTVADEAARIHIRRSSEEREEVLRKLAAELRHVDQPV